MAQSEILSRFQKILSPVSKPKIRKIQENGSIFYRKCFVGVKNHISGLFCRMVIRKAPKSATPTFTQIATVATFEGQYLANQKSYLSGISDRIRT